MTTLQEVWIRAYCAVLLLDKPPSFDDPRWYADKAVADFKATWYAVKDTPDTSAKPATVKYQRGR